MNADISPVIRATPQVMRPMTRYPSNAPTGPAVAIAWPEAKKRPVPCSVLVSYAVQSSSHAYNHPCDGYHVDMPPFEVFSDCSLVRSGRESLDVALIGGISLDDWTCDTHLRIFVVGDHGCDCANVDVEYPRCRYAAVGRRRSRCDSPVARARNCKERLSLPRPWGSLQARKLISLQCILVHGPRPLLWN